MNEKPLYMIDIYGSGEDVVIAESPEDACALLGLNEEDKREAVFDVYDPEDEFTRIGEDGTTRETKTCAEWCKQEGRGHFATTYT